MDSCISQSEFSPLEEVLDNVSVGGVVPGEELGLGRDGEENGMDLNEVFQEEVSSELTEGILGVDSRTGKDAAARRRRLTWAGRFPCAVCGKGVRNGLICVTCSLWVHHGKTNTCSGLEKKCQYNAKTYSCPTCIEKQQNISQKTDNPNIENNKKQNSTNKRSLERADSESGEEVSPTSKRTKNNGISPKNTQSNINEDISKTQDILNISINSNDISVISSTEKVSYEEFCIEQMIKNFQSSDKNDVIKFAEKFEKENLIKQTKVSEICGLFECFDANEYKNEGGYKIKEIFIKCLKPLRNKKQTLIKAIIFLNQNKEDVECYVTNKNIEELIEILMYNIYKRMPMVCEECANIYCDKINNNPNVRCYICKLGKHECQEQSLKFVYEDTKLLNNMKGVMWMCPDCREFTKDNKLVEKIRDQIILENIEKNKKIRNSESNTQNSTKHPEAEQRKINESEDKTNKNRQKSIVKNSIEKENKQ